MEKTGVFATPEELEILKGVAQTSGMWIGGPPPNPAKTCHEYALKHGLPEITGYYGITGNGEFVRT